MSGLVSGIVGIQTSPTQPAVLANNSDLDTDVTGAGATTTIDYDTEIFDQGGDFDNDTFTAPVTGIYCVLASAGIQGRTSSHNGSAINILASNRYHRFEPAHHRSDTAAVMIATALMDMDAADTLTITVRNQGESSDVHDIRASGEGTQFSIFLMG